MRVCMCVSVCVGGDVGKKGGVLLNIPYDK